MTIDELGRDPAILRERINAHFAEIETLRVRLAAVEARLAMLEGAIFYGERRQPAASSMPLPQGCLCPPGAELSCGSASCPRRGWRYSAGVTS